MDIFGPTTVTIEQAEAWARGRNAHPRFIAMFPIYFQQAPRYGIPAENLLGQASWETNDGHYTGQVPPEYHNWCGLKTRTATGDRPEDHQVFLDDFTGATAHAQHLAGYGGKKKEELPDPLVDPRFHLIKKFTTTIEGLGGAWAPSPTYGQRVAARISELKATEPPMAAFEMPSSINGIPVRKAFIPWGNSNRPGTQATAEGQRWITVHETGNARFGADAEMHRAFTHGKDGWGGGGHPATATEPEYEGVSFTFVVDDTEIVWLLPLEEKSWQASDGANGTGNSSASIESCINADGDWGKTQENVAQLVAFLATNAPNRSVERVAQHNKWARDGKNCPSRLRANGGAGWNALMARVIDIAAGNGQEPEPGGEPDWDALIAGAILYENGKHVPRAFDRHWRENGSIRAFGFPISGAEPEVGADGVKRLTQYFERAVLRYFPEFAGTDNEVQGDLLGVFALAEREAAD